MNLVVRFTGEVVLGQEMLDSMTTKCSFIELLSCKSK